MTEPCTTQAEYWDSMAHSAAFTHPLNLDTLSKFLRKGHTIVDYGCGYGRLCAQLDGHGWTVIGLDTSAALVERGHQEHPRIDLRTMPGGHAPLATDSVDAVLLFAVLTCIADNRSQARVMADVHRILRPGGLVVLSDYGLQTDTRNLARYEKWAKRLGTYGCFEIESGVVMRHYGKARFEQLLSGFEILQESNIQTQTFRGHDVEITQIWAREV